MSDCEGRIPRNGPKGVRWTRERSAAVRRGMGWGERRIRPGRTKRDPRVCAVCGESPCFVHCVHCGVNVDTQSHHLDCPQVTNIWPSEPELGILCSMCDEPVGTSYAYVEEDGLRVGCCLFCAIAGGLDA